MFKGQPMKRQPNCTQDGSKFSQSSPCRIGHKITVSALHKRGDIDQKSQILEDLIHLNLLSEKEIKSNCMTMPV